jgi:hypothetical protein
VVLLHHENCLTIFHTATSEYTYRTSLVLSNITYYNLLPAIDRTESCNRVVRAIRAAVDTDRLEWDFLLFSSAPPCKCRDTTFN